MSSSLIPGHGRAHTDIDDPFYLHES